MLKLNYRNVYNDPDWRKMMDNLDPADIPQLLAFVDAKVPKFMRQGLRFNLLPRWAQSDPQGAMAYAQTIPNLQERQNAIGMVATGWAQKDPTGATAWAQQLPKGQLRDRVLSSVISAIAGSNPQAAFDLFQSSDLNGWQYMPAYNLFSTWAAQNPATAAAQAAKLTSGRQRQQAFQAIAAAWAQNDPQAAMTWANSLSNGQDKRNAISSIISGWAQSDVNGAMAWAKQLPEGQTKQQAVSSGCSWARNQAAGGGGLATVSESSNTKNSVLGSIISQWLQQDPDAAMEYVSEIFRRPGRNRICSKPFVAVSWQDPKSAAALASLLPAGQ